MLKRIISFLLIFAMMVPLLVVGVSAEDEYPPDDFMTWTQFDSRWGSYKYGTTNTIQQSGCMIASLAVLIAYSDPSKRDWTVFNPKILVQNSLYISGNGLARWEVHDLEGGDNFLYVACQVSDNRATAKEYVRSNMEEGNYSMVWASSSSYSHFCPVVGWNSESDEPIVWDVGSGAGAPTTCETGCIWNTSFTKGTTFKVISYKSLITSSLDTVYNDNFSPGGGSTSSSSEEAFENMTAEQQEEHLIASHKLAKEWELNGMPKKSDMVSDQIDLDIVEELTWDYYLQVNSASIKETMDQDKITIAEVIRAAFTFVGIALITYALFLILAYGFDKSNTFIDISLVHLFTFGAIRLYDDLEDKNIKKQGYISEKAFFLRIVIISIVGILFVSGTVSVFIYRVSSLLG